MTLIDKDWDKKTQIGPKWEQKDITEDPLKAMRLTPPPPDSEHYYEFIRQRYLHKLVGDPDFLKLRCENVISEINIAISGELMNIPALVRWRTLAEDIMKLIETKAVYIDLKDIYE